MSLSVRYFDWVLGQFRQFSLFLSLVVVVVVVVVGGGGGGGGGGAFYYVLTKNLHRERASDG